MWRPVNERGRSPHQLVPLGQYESARRQQEPQGQLPPSRQAPQQTRSSVPPCCTLESGSIGRRIRGVHDGNCTVLVDCQDKEAALMRQLCSGVSTSCHSNSCCSIAMPIVGRAAARLATHRRWLVGAAATATSSAGVGAVKKAQMGVVLDDCTMMHIFNLHACT